MTSVSTRHPATDAGHHGESDRYLLEWGPNGIRSLAPVVQVVIIVDVVWFSTLVSLIVEAHAVATLPRRHPGRSDENPLPSSTELMDLALGATSHQRIEIPDPEHAVMAIAAAEYGAPHVLAGCLRNASATARLAHRLAGDEGTIGIVVVGERWRSRTGPMRPCVVDLLGAGAIVAALDPSAAVSRPRSSPEAAAARSAFIDARPLMGETIMRSATARILRSAAPPRSAASTDDLLMLASAVDVTDTAALFVDGTFTPVVG